LKTTGSMLASILRLPTDVLIELFIWTIPCNGFRLHDNPVICPLEEDSSMQSRIKTLSSIYPHWWRILISILNFFTQYIDTKHAKTEFVLPRQFELSGRMALDICLKYKFEDKIGTSILTILRNHLDRINALSLCYPLSRHATPSRHPNFRNSYVQVTIILMYRRYTCFGWEKLEIGQLSLPNTREIQLVELPNASCDDILACGPHLGRF